MSSVEEVSPLDLARQAAKRGEWSDAYARLAELNVVAPLSGEALVLLADVAYNAGRVDVCIDTWERAYAESLAVGNRLAAAGAAVQVALHLLFDTALMAPIRAWARRTERLLEGQDETPIHAWLAVVHTYERLLSGDFEANREWARRAIELGGRHAPAAAAIGRVAEARGLILEGAVKPGLALLDEAAVAAVSGEIDPLSTGIVYCEVICGLQALAQYDLAEQWAEAMEQWHPGQPVGSVHGRCRVHKAEVLRLRGECAEAHQEILRACDELRPYLRRELGWPLTELGRIRLRMGDLEGAQEAFLEAHEAGWDPQPGLALVRLRQGDLPLSADSIRDALEHPRNVPSKEWPPNTELRRAPLLEADVEIAIACGDLTRARRSAEELRAIAKRFESNALAASAALAEGNVLLAAGNAGAARAAFDVALQAWNDIGAPFEAALSRMGLGNALRAAGEEHQAIMEFKVARAAFEHMGAALHVADADRACEAAPRTRLAAATEQSPMPGSREPAAESNTFRQEGEYWLVVFEGSTVRLRDLKGLRYLARLLAQPGREFHALDLVAGEARERSDLDFDDSSRLALRPATSAGELLDAQAKQAYRRRLTEIEEDIEEARAFGDDERAAQADEERDFLIRELARAIGLGGRDRRSGSPSERARVSVTRAIRQSISRIDQHCPMLGAHLNHAIRTGIYCAYSPDPRALPDWTLG